MMAGQMATPPEMIGGGSRIDWSPGPPPHLARKIFTRIVVQDVNISPDNFCIGGQGELERTPFLRSVSEEISGDAVLYHRLLTPAKKFSENEVSKQIAN